MTDLDELILYRNFENGQIIEDMCRILEQLNDEAKWDKVKERFFSCMHALIDLAGTYGFEGNLWHDYLALLLVNNENVFSTSCEISGNADGSLLTLAKHDFTIFMRLFALDFSGLEEKLDVGFFEEILHYRRGTAEGRVFNRRIRDRICELAAQLAEDSKVLLGTDQSIQTDIALEQFTGHMVRFYREFGVGKFGLHKAFRVEHRDDSVCQSRSDFEMADATCRRCEARGHFQGVQILPITNIAHVKLDDLVGYEIQKKKLIDNTEAFLNGKRANNCLLFGDAGTGKSSSIKGILNQYYDQGLRMIEIYKHQFQDLNAVIAQIKNRNYKFIIYMDDLSFEEFEIEYKYLKAVIEGGLEKRPENVLIYATSNRRHLIREQFGDNMEGDIGKPAEIHATHGGDLHVSDTVQEKLSLSSRFGVTIYFGSPDKKQFQNIVRTLAERYGITMPEEQLLAEANKWELSHGGLSGRTAVQFVDYISAMQ